MKAYFSRNVPFYLMEPAECRDVDSFDAYEVDAPEKAVSTAQQLRHLALHMQSIIAANSAPEECAQAEADEFVIALGRITNG